MNSCCAKRARGAVSAGCRADGPHRVATGLKAGLQQAAGGPHRVGQACWQALKQAAAVCGHVSRAQTDLVHDAVLVVIHRVDDVAQGGLAHGNLIIVYAHSSSGRRWLQPMAEQRAPRLATVLDGYFSTNW